MWNSRGLPSPAVAQEVEDVWRGRRVLLSLSTLGNSQPRPSQRDGGTAEEWDPVVTCPEHRPRLGQEPLLSPTSVVIMMD